VSGHTPSPTSLTTICFVLAMRVIATSFGLGSIFVFITGDWTEGALMLVLSLLFGIRADTTEARGA
jgi:hypothetical protein